MDPGYQSLRAIERDLRHGKLSLGGFEARIRGHRALWSKLHLSATLTGHTGCVNCVEWNANGSLLVSGSDDRNVAVWSVNGKEVAKFPTEHTGNIFAAKFLNECNDSKIATGAADGSVIVHQWRNTEGGEVETLREWTDCRRVKQVVLTTESPFLVYACGEEGHIMLYDIRQPEPNTLYFFEATNCKALAVNPVKPKEMAIGFQGEGAKLFDIRCGNTPFFSFANPIITTRSRNLHQTVSYVEYNRTGSKLLVNVHNDAIYVYDANKDPSHGPKYIERMEQLLNTPDVYLERLEDPEELIKENINPREFNEQLTRAREYALVDHEDTVATFNDLIYTIELTLSAVPGDKMLQAELACLLRRRADALLREGFDGSDMEAVRDYIRALELFPMNAEAVKGICGALEHLQQYTLARKWAKLYVERFKWDGDSILANPTTIPVKRWTPKTMEKIREHSERYLGACNIRTDIKQARFAGANDEFIAAGSDCGRMFIWERATRKIIRLIKADQKILNVVAPHPTTVILATSGLEHVVRLWKPFMTAPEVFPEAESVWRSRDVTSQAAQIVRRNHTEGFSVGFRNMELLFRMAQLRNQQVDVNDGCRTT
uniref:WD_REPEATS_REGION domain-containing protein n=1 Tax=Panagrellus redivivus TaxID=6233 RepID=A0A7E4VTL0_PANRE